jgi:TP901 family phage tail tape measure protein
MALSGREVMLILRARDEASRTIGRLSGAMARADRDAMRSAEKSTQQSKRNLNILGNAAHDVQYNYQRMALEARKAYMEGSGSLAQRSKQLQREMLAARTYRTEQMRNIELNRRAAKEQIAQADQINRSIREQHQLRRHAAQQTLASGTAAVTAGAGMIYFGVQATRAYLATINDAMDYNTQVARTATQVDKANVSMSKLSDIGKDVGRNVPIAFEQIQPALYDIFSSIDVGYKGAGKLLKQFSKDAVGGQTDLETATRANLQIMNAYKISTKDASKVSDFMFRLVQKGVGTYDEFAKSIGRAIPSAARANQSYKTLGAMMAFMTRNGVSAAMAATSSARALDALTNSKTVSKLHDMGIEVKDASGNFKPLPGILANIAKKMKGMGSVKRAAFLQELFKGSGGTIQARRFFDMYFKNADEFNKRNKEMQDSAGQAEKAFARMAESPQAKLQKFQNQIKLLRIEAGEALLPMVMKVLDWFTKLANKWNDMDPDTRKLILQIGLFGTALLIVVGAITAIVGAIMIFVGALGLVGASFGGILALAGGLAVLLAGVATAGYLIYKNWDKVKPVAQNMLDALGSAYNWVTGTFGPGLSAIWDGLKKGVQELADGIKRAWDNFNSSVDVKGIKKDWDDFVNDVQTKAPQINAAMTAMGKAIELWFRALSINIQVMGAFWGPMFTGMVQAVISFARGIVGVLSGVVTFIQGWVNIIHGFLIGNWGMMWKGVQQITSGAMTIIVGLFHMLMGPLHLVQGFVNGVINAFQHLYDVLVGHSIVPDLVNAIGRWFGRLPGLVAGKIASLPGRVIGYFARLASGAMNAISGLPGRVGGVFSRVASQATSKASSAWNQVVNAFQSGVRSAVAAVQHLPSGVLGILSSLAGSAYSAGASVQPVRSQAQLHLTCLTRLPRSGRYPVRATRSTQVWRSPTASLEA